MPLPEWTDVYLGLGANLGYREENIALALQKLAELPTITIVRVSSLCETAPVGLTEQPRFLNGAVHIHTILSAPALLARILQIEQDMGRIRNLRWGPRTIDIDVLLYGEEVICTEELCVPHPRLAEREFVLRPLTEIAPHVVVPGLQKNVKDLLKELLDLLPKQGTNAAL